LDSDGESQSDINAEPGALEDALPAEEDYAMGEENPPDDEDIEIASRIANGVSIV
jgi:hypothetical protein